jgi:hypothetical protein
MEAQDISCVLSYCFLRIQEIKTMTDGINELSFTFNRLVYCRHVYIAQHGEILQEET